MAYFINNLRKLQETNTTTEDTINSNYTSNNTTQLSNTDSENITTSTSNTTSTANIIDTNNTIIEQTLPSDTSGFPIVIVIIGGIAVILGIIVGIILFKKLKKKKDAKADASDKDKVPSVKDSKKSAKPKRVENKENDNDEDKNKTNYENDVTLDRTDRKLIYDNDVKEAKASKESKNKTHSNALTLLKEKIKEVEHLEMNIKEEIENLRKNKTKDDKSVRINSEASKNSKVSAHKLIKRHSINRIICYTDEHRSEPNESFYNMKIDDLHEEKKAQEKDEIEAQKREKELEEALKRKLKKEDEEEQGFDLNDIDDNGISDTTKKRSSLNTFDVKDRALMTDFSEKVKKDGIEFFKNIPSDFIKSKIIF